MKERSPISVIRDGKGNPVIIHIKKPQMVDPDLLKHIVDSHMFGKNPKVAVLIRRGKPQEPLSADKYKSQDRKTAVGLVAFAILNVREAIIRPARTSTSF